MDKFKCIKCEKIFDEFEADYNFMSKNGKELCSECINKLEDTDYIRGLKAGVRLYAWWKDGVQYVGTCGTTLKHALERINKDETKDN